MAVFNESTAEFLFVYQQAFKLNERPITKCTVAMLMSLFFMYVNGVMFYALRSKRVFKETPRYVLFSHTLLNDSVQLLFTSVVYCINLAFLKVVTAACSFIVFVSAATFFNAPLNLAVMSLERFVAIRFPLRHAEIATQRRIYLAIALVWCASSMSFMVDLIFGITTDPDFLTTQAFCTRERFFLKPWQLSLYHGFSVFCFVSVTMVIAFTYVSIMVTARSVSSNKESAMKAYRTVLLHFVQLCLCLTTFLYSIIEHAAATLGNSALFLDVRYVVFLFVLILPRCLSPLIYGLRDEALRPLFMYYFRFGTGRVKPSVSVQ